MGLFERLRLSDCCPNEEEIGICKNMDMIKAKRLTAFILLLSIMAMMSLFGGCVRSGIDKAENSTVDTNKSVYNDIYELSEFLTEEQYDE